MSCFSRRKPELTLRREDMGAYAGNWVAVKDGRLVMFDVSLNNLMEQLSHIGTIENGVTIWFEERPEGVEKWCVMYRDRPGYVYPNCFFSTRSAAMDWIYSWSADAYVMYRKGQHAQWEDPDAPVDD